MKNSIQVHKEMIAELEANLKLTNEEFERMNGLFDETKQKLEKKNTDIENCRKWINHLKDELVTSLDRINDKSMKIAEYNFTIEEFEKILMKLHKDANNLKCQLDDTSTNAQKLENKLKTERAKVDKVYNSSLKFDSNLKIMTENMTQNQLKLVNIVDSYKTSYQSKIDDLLKNIENHQEKMNQNILKMAENVDPIVNKFRDTLQDVSKKWSNVSEKMIDFVNINMNGISKDIIDVFIKEMLQNEICNIKKTIENFEKEIFDNIGKDSKMEVLLNSINEFINMNNVKIQKFNTDTYNLVETLLNGIKDQNEKENFESTKFEQNLKEDLILNEKEFLMKQISNLIDERFENINGNILNHAGKVFFY